MKKFGVPNMPSSTKSNRDHAQRHNTPTLDNEAIANQL